MTPAAQDTLGSLAEAGIFSDKENPNSERDRYRVLCPFHNDREPSLSIHANGLVWKCFASCGKGGPQQMREMLDGDLVPRISQVPKQPKPAAKRGDYPTGCTSAQLSEAKGLPTWLMREWGWADDKWHGIRAIRIPYSNGSVRYRVDLQGKQRFRWEKGSTPGLYGIDRLSEADKVVLVVEGETDTLAASLMGIQAIGVPGASSWKPEWAKALECRDLVVWREPDTGGQNLVDRVAKDIPNLRFIDAKATGVGDLCDLLTQVGEDIDRAQDWLMGLIEEAPRYYPALEEDEDVLFKVDRESTLYYKKDKRWKPRKRDNTRPSALWEFCYETFPDPPGVEPKVKSHILYSAAEGQALVCDLRSTTWLNPANAAFKKRKFLYHGTRKLSRFDALYMKYVPVDDWSEKFHDAKTKAIDRAGGLYLAFDNRLSRGYWAYLSTVPIDGFTQLEDLSGWLVGVLSGIRVPNSIPKGHRFRPIRGTRVLTKGCDAPVDEDRGKYAAVAVSEEATDWNLLEAELRAAGRIYEQVDPVYRAQHCWGIRFAANSLEEVQEFALGFGGVYQLRRRGKESTEERTAAGVGL
jgi:CHC2 zinc finger